MELFQNPEGKSFWFYLESLKSSEHTAVVFKDAMYVFGGSGETSGLFGRNSTVIQHTTLHKYIFGTQSTWHIESTKLLLHGQTSTTQDRSHHTV